MALRIRLYNTNPSEAGFTTPGKITTADGVDTLSLYNFNQNIKLNEIVNTKADTADTSKIKPIVYKTGYDAGVKATATIPIGTANLAAGSYAIVYEQRFIDQHMPETMTAGGEAPIIGTTTRVVEFTLSASTAIASAVAIINRSLNVTRQTSSDLIPVVTASGTSIVLTMPTEFGYFFNTGIFAIAVTNGIPSRSTTPMVTTTYVQNRRPFGNYDFIKQTDILENSLNTMAYRINDGNQPIPGETYSLYVFRSAIPSGLIETNQIGYSGAFPTSDVTFKIWVKTSLVSAFETAISATVAGGDTVKILLEEISTTS